MIIFEFRRVAWSIQSDQEKSKVSVVIKRSRTFRSQAKSMSSIQKNRIEQLINHYVYGEPLSGVDKWSEGVLKENYIRHFHINLNELDPLVAYQFQGGILNLIRVTTHEDNFHGNEAEFLESIKDDLL